MVVKPEPGGSDDTWGEIINAALDDLQGQIDIREPGLVYRGLWSAGATYQPDDAVTYEGSSYIAVGNPLAGAPPATPDGAPTAQWQYLSARGAGVPTGGAAGHLLRKASGADYHTAWAPPEVPAAPLVPKVLTGTADVVVALGSNASTLSIAFPAGYFTAAPSVVANVDSSSMTNYRQHFIPRCLGAAVSGFTLWLVSADGYAITGSAFTFPCNWIAVQPA